MKFKEGDILEFDGMGPYAAEKGATATCNGYTIKDGVEYVQVIWNIDKLWNGQNDGGYEESQFKKIGEVSTQKEDRILKENKKVMKKENRNIYFTFDFDEGKERVIKMLEESIENFTHDMLIDVRSVINDEDEDVIDQIESIIDDIRTHERFIKEAIEKVKESTTVLEILGAMENTSFEEEEETVLCALFGLMSITREG